MATGRQERCLTQPPQGRSVAPVNHGRAVTAPAASSGTAQTAALPACFQPCLAAFELFLAAERGLSAHTVRAYLGDVTSLLESAAGAGAVSPQDIVVGHIRGWLAHQYARGLSRSTLARRGAAARTFTAFAHRRGWLAADPGPLLGTVQARRPLPHVLHAGEVAAVLRQATGGATADAAGWAITLRDAAVLELLYATGIRVSELCGLNLPDVDVARRTVRVLGKGGKQRTVPVGLPAMRALDRWWREGRPMLVTGRSGPALLLGARGGRLNARVARRIVHAAIAGAMRPPPICWKAVLICGAYRRYWATLRSPPRRSTLMSRLNAWSERTGARIRVRDLAGKCQRARGRRARGRRARGRRRHPRRDQVHYPAASTA